MSSQVSQTIEECSSTFLQFPRDIIFYDTCIWLNIFDAVYDKNITPINYHDKMREIIDLAINEKIYLVTSETVTQEGHINLDRLKEICKQNIARIYNDFSKIKENSPIQFGIPEKAEMTSQILGTREAIFRDFYDQTDVIKTSDAIRRDAEQRRYHPEGAKAPATTGNANREDCEIVECFLHLAQHLRNNGYQKKIVFISSNTNDFGKKDDMKHPLGQEFSQVSALFWHHLSLIDNL